MGGLHADLRLDRSRFLADAASRTVRVGVFHLVADYRGEEVPVDGFPRGLFPPGRYILHECFATIVSNAEVALCLKKGVRHLSFLSRTTMERR